MKILVVDDDKALLGALARVLKEHDHEADCIDNAREAAEMVEKTKYDFVLLDYKMPQNDGIWFMKNAKVPRETKILLITAYVNRKVVNKMFELGASGYLIKPFDGEEIVRHLAFYSQK